MKKINIKIPDFRRIHVYQTLVLFFLVIIIAILGATPIFSKIATKNKISKIANFLEPAYLLIILVTCTSYIINSSFNPFLYFRF